MSPVSRGRKNAKSRGSGQRVVRSVPVAPPEPCDCPACSGEGLDLETLVEGMMISATNLLETDDPIEAELFGASFLAAGVAGDLPSEEVIAAVTESIVPAAAKYANREALALLLALDTMGVGPAPAEAARHLLEAGVQPPSWAAEVREPVQVSRCLRYADAPANSSALVCSFERAGRSHGFVVDVDHGDCDAAVDIVLFAPEELAEFTQTIEVGAAGVGFSITTEVLDPAEFRWQVERALDARAVHDFDEDEPLLADPDDEDEGPGYHLLAALLQTRMHTLPEPPRPPAPHGDETADPSAAEEGFYYLTARKPRPDLPPRRTKEQGAAPIYQIKVGLRRAKPPIWRRLELPADTSLADLHRIIQAAFAWEDSHLHVFETPYGEFGVPDPELDHRAEAPVTLEQVAPGAGDRFEYTYDLGDSWTHLIEVEKVLDRQAVVYPRCTGGRRAAPPEDCGGIGGYEDLIEALADPSHPGHRTGLKWMGLRSPAEFDPARFDAAEVNRALTDLP
ncbi:MAG: plasmid pRiA4b ORF-3 family protein [Actinoplanes sp.]